MKQYGVLYGLFFLLIFIAFNAWLFPEVSSRVIDFETENLVQFHSYLIIIFLSSLGTLCFLFLFQALINYFFLQDLIAALSLRIVMGNALLSLSAYFLSQWGLHIAVFITLSFLWHFWILKKSFPQYSGPLHRFVWPLFSAFNCLFCYLMIALTLASLKGSKLMLVPYY